MYHITRHQHDDFQGCHKQRLASPLPCAGLLELVTSKAADAGLYATRAKSLQHVPKTMRTNTHTHTHEQIRVSVCVYGSAALRAVLRVLAAKHLAV